MIAWGCVVVSSLLSAGGSLDGGFPLAAVFPVPSGGLVVARVDGGISVLPRLAGFRFLDGDLSHDGLRVIASAEASGSVNSELYWFDGRSPDAGWQRVPLPPAGFRGAPRFRRDGRGIVFSARAGPGPGGPGNPTQVFGLASLASTAPVRLSQANACYFGAAPVSEKAFVAVKTNCFFSPTLVVGNAVDAGVRETQLGLAQPDDEFAASPDGRVVVQLQRADGFIRALDVGTGRRELFRLSENYTGHLHPRFICPRDLMFTANGSVFIVNTYDGGVSKVGIDDR